jgi:hypothetical protein
MVAAQQADKDLTRGRPRNDFKKEPAPGDGPGRVSRYALRPPVNDQFGLSADKVNLRLTG